MRYEAFEQAAQFFVDTVAKVRQDQWDDPALGVWNVRDLVGHTSRALLTAQEYADRPAEKRDIGSSAEYYHAALGVEGIDDQVAERGKLAGDRLGADPLGFVKNAIDRVRPVVDRMDGEALIDFNGKGIRYADYLPTRVLELTVHTLDLAHAIGVETDPPTEALSVTLHLLADLAVDSGHGGALALAATGRGRLPDRFSVLG